MRHAAFVKLRIAIVNFHAVSSNGPGCLRCFHAHASQPGGLGADLFANRRVLTLERSIGANLGRDADLWRSGAFHVSIYPDLPAAMTWADLLRQPFKRYMHGALIPSTPARHMGNVSLIANIGFRSYAVTADAETLQRETYEAPSTGQTGHVVRTVGIQVRIGSRPQAHRRYYLRVCVHSYLRGCCGS